MKIGEKASLAVISRLGEENSKELKAKLSFRRFVDLVVSSRSNRQSPRMSDRIESLYLAVPRSAESRLLASREQISGDESKLIISAIVSTVASHNFSR